MTMIHYTDRYNFDLEQLATATDEPGIWLYPAGYEDEWDGRYAVEFSLDSDSVCVTISEEH